MPGYGRGMGRGMGRGRGQGGGRGMGMGRSRWFGDEVRENTDNREYNYSPDSSTNFKKASLAQLKEQARLLEQQLQEINRHIKELEEEGVNYESKNTSATASGTVKAHVKEEACIGCRVCERVCPTGAIYMDGRIARVVESKCIGCGDCAERCPGGAIYMA